MEIRIYDDETVNDYAIRVLEEWVKARSRDEARDILRTAGANLNDEMRERYQQAFWNIINGECPENEKAKALRAFIRSGAGCQSP